MTCNDKTSYVSTPPCIIIITYRVIMIIHMVLLWEWHFMLSAFHLCRNPIHHMSSSCHFGLNPTLHTLTPCKQIRHDLSTWCWFRIEGLGYRDEGTLTTLRRVELLSSLPQPQNPIPQLLKNESHVDLRQDDTSFRLALGWGVEMCGLGFRQRWQLHGKTSTGYYAYPVAHVNESRDTRGCVTSYTWMSHVTRVGESRHTFGWDASIRRVLED